MKKKNVKGVALVVASYLLVGGLTGYMGFVVGQDNGINKIYSIRDYGVKDVIAKVDGEEILSKDLKHRMDIFSEVNGDAYSLSEDEINKLEADYVEYIAVTEALYKKATKEGIKATDEELNSHYESTMGQVCQMLGKDIQGVLRKFSMSEDYVRENIKKELLASKYLSEKVKVSDADIKKEYEKDPSKYNQVRASHILIAPGEGAVKDSDLKAEAQSILDKVKAGENFEELAKANSDDSTATNGGDLDFFSKGTMVEPFEKAVFSLKKGEVYPELVETDFGYHIIKKTDEKTQTLDDVKETIKQELTANGQDKLMQKAIDEYKVEIKYGVRKDKKIDLTKNK